MDSYSILIKRTAEKELRDLPRPDLGRITGKIRKLADVPRPSGSEKLSDREQYRIREGDYRIVYEIDDERRLINIVKIGHRREVYRK